MGAFKCIHMIEGRKNHSCGVIVSPTHICLNELGALLSYLRDKPKHVNLLLCVHHVDHGIYYDEGSCPPNTSAAGTQNKPQTVL